MIKRGQLSQSKLTDLCFVKKFVDGVATTDYVGDLEAKQLKETYGAFPDVLTWGDYFQTEIASDFFDSPDDEFHKIIQTVRFDLIAAIKIFHGKPAQFFEIVKERALEAGSRPEEQWSGDDEEAVHLGILCRYFEEMGLDRATVSEEDLQWFDTFSIANANAV